jgi:hypothetical protein
MALKKYIGARYTPKFMGAWDAQTVYAALSVVYANEQSYVSRKTVPAGTEVTNTEYWVKSADWNAQVAEYNRNVENYNRNVEEYNKNVVAYEQAVNTFYADTLHSYDNKAAMVADQDLKLGDTLLTCGDKTIGDNGGSFYQVVAETSAKAVALENGLYALPFEFQPYDYSEFAEKTDQYKQETDAQIAQMKEVSLHTYNTQTQMKADRSLTPNTVVMTAGEAAIGDNKGSFYEIQEASDKNDAVPLDNGNKAVPFALNVGTIAGNALTFNGKSEAAGIWNVKAPASLTIPLTIPQGGTAMTYLAVLYTSTSATVTANVTVNGTGQELTFIDKSDSGYEKFVVYAITCKNTDTIYWSKSTVSSWQTEYKAGSIGYNTKFGANAPAELKDIAFIFTSDLVFKPTKDIILDSVTVKLPTGTYTTTDTNPSGVEVYVYNETTNNWDKLYTKYSTPTSGVHTFNITSEHVLKADKYYRLSTLAWNTSISLGRYMVANEAMSVQSGTFDIINVSKPSNISKNNNFNGIIAYHTAI